MQYREFRTGASENEGKLSGIAAPFNSVTTIGDLKRGGWREEIAPGAFAKAIAEGDTVLLCDHDTSKPLARVSAGTLSLREEKDGMHFEGEPAPTTYAQDLFINIRAGNKGGMSIGFDPVKDEWFDDKGRPSNRYVGTKRILREVKLPEVSVVTNPAYKDTSVMARDELLAEREARAGNAPGNGKKPYGNVKYADPGYQKDGKKRYPIDTKDHVYAAWSYINQLKNASAYSAQQLAKIKSRIKAAAAKYGIKISGSRSVDLTDYCPRHGIGKCEKRHGKPVAEKRIKKGVVKRVLQIDAELDQAFAILSKSDNDDVKKATALISSAQTHVGHIKDVEKLKGAKVPRSKQKPESSTSADDEELALRMQISEAMQRSRELGFV